MPADREARVGPGERRVQPRAPLSGPLWPTVCACVWGPRGRAAPVHPAPPCSFHRLCSTFASLSRVPLWWGGWGWRALTHGGGPFPRPWELAGLGAVPLMPLPQRWQHSQGEAEAEAGQLVRGSEQGPGELPGGQGHGLSVFLARQSPALGGPLPSASVPRTRPRPRSKPGGPTLLAGPHPRASSGSEPPPWRLLGASSGPSPSAQPSFREPWTWGAQAGTPAPPPGPLPGPSLSYWTRSSRELIPKATGCGEGAEAGVPLGHQAETW